MPSPPSPSEISALVSELATLPNTFDSLHSSTRLSSLNSLRRSIRLSFLPAFARALVLRTVSRLLGPASPPENASWTALPLWNEEALETLCKLLVDALDECGYEEWEKKLSTLPVTEKHVRKELSEFGKLMLTPQEQASLTEQTSDSDSDEDEIFPTAASILPNPPEQPQALQAAISGSQPAQLAAAHVSHALATTARHDRAPAVRRAAFLALAALARAMPPELLAAFLPGLASTLARGLQNTILEQAPVVVAALDAFASVVLSAFPAIASLNREGDPVAHSFAAALEQRRSRKAATMEASAAPEQNGTVGPASKINPPAPRGLLVSRSASWSSAASREVSLRVRLFFESHSGPSPHSSVRARLAVARFARVLLSHESMFTLDAHAQCLLRLALVEKAGDRYPVVRIEALRAVKKLVKMGRMKVKEIERGFSALIKAADRRVENVDVGRVDREVGTIEKKDVLDGEQSMESRDVEDSVVEKLMVVRDDEFWVGLCDGYLRVLVPSEGEISNKRLSILNSSDKLAGSLTRIGVNPLCRMLMSMHEAIWAPSADPEDAIFAELDNRVLATSFQMGQAGLLATLYSTLFSYGWCTVDEETVDFGDPANAVDGREMLSSFKPRAHAILILQAAVRGAIANNDLAGDEIDGYVRLVSQCTKEVLGAMTTFLLPTMEDSLSDGAGQVDDAMISLKRCLLHCTSELIKELSIAYEKLCSKPLESDVVLVVLLSVLRDVSHSEKTIRKTAEDTLQNIARTARCADDRRLIARHLNYLISRLTKHLEERWAGDVLSFIIGSDGDDVSKEATILLEATLRDLNNSLAGAGDARALKSLAAIESVLVTAVRQSQNEGRKDETSPSDERCEGFGIAVISETGSARLHQKLFLYCTEDISDLDDLTTAKEREGENSENSRDREEDILVRSAFETVALSTLDGMRDLLVGRPWHVRASALSCATWAVYLLKDNQKDLLPHAANILPLLPDQFVVLKQNVTAGDRLLHRIKQKKVRGQEDASDVADLVNDLNGKGAELPVVTSACLLLSALAKCAGSFIRNRFVKLIYPNMRPLLRLASCFPTLIASSTMKHNGKLTSPPSHGSMSASDACLEAIASMAAVLPEALAPHSISIVKHLAVYFSPQYDPRSRGQRNTGHLNRSMLRYERERWQKRAAWADSIVHSVKTVNLGDVLTSLLCSDESAPANIAPRHPSLHSVTVRKTQSGVR